MLRKGVQCLVGVLSYEVSTVHAWEYSSSTYSALSGSQNSVAILGLNNPEESMISENPWVGKLACVINLCSYQFENHYGYPHLVE